MFEEIVGANLVFARFISGLCLLLRRTQILKSLNVLDRIGFQPDPSALAARLRLDTLTGALPLERMLAGSVRLARPRAAFALFEPVARSRDSVEIAGQVFSSRVLRVNLSGARTAALFVATCGVELERWAQGLDDPLERWVADEICEEALGAALRVLEDALDGELDGKYRVSMNPGSLEDWPLTEQEPLFCALERSGDVAGATGVELTESFLMKPRKSLSGVRFASGEQFADCVLCPRRDCSARRMPYEPERFGRQYDGARRGSLYAGTCGREPLGGPLSEGR